MSYGRVPYYIRSDGDTLYFGIETSVPEEQINAFLFKILLVGRRDELARRLRDGQQAWVGQADQAWIDRQVDDLLRQLMKGESPCLT